MVDNREQEITRQRTLVTGASGFIGRRLCTELVDNAYHLNALVRESSSTNFLPKSEDVRIYRAELVDSDALEKACQGVSSVYHLASIAHVGMPNEVALQKAIVDGTRNVATAAKKSGAQNFVYFSSSLAASIDQRPDNSPYARFKKAAEEIVLSMADSSFKVCVLRPVNVYGPGMKGNIPGLIRRIRTGKLPSLPRLSNEIPLVSVEDLCEAAILAAESSGSAGQIYTVTDGQAYTPNDIEAAVYEALGQKKPGWHTPRVVFYAASLGAQIANNLGLWNNDLGLRTYRNLTGQGTGPVPSNEKIRAELGFQPQRTFQSELPAILSAL